MSEPGQRSARAQGACTCRTGQSKTFFRYKEISLVTYPLATELRSCPRQDDCDLVLIWLTQLSRPVCDKYCETLLASITDSNAPFCRCSRDLRCRRRGFLRPSAFMGTGVAQRVRIPALVSLRPCRTVGTGGYRKGTCWAGDAGTTGRDREQARRFLYVWRPW